MDAKRLRRPLFRRSLPLTRFQSDFFEKFVLTDRAETDLWIERIETLLDVATIERSDFPRPVKAAFLRDDLPRKAWRSHGMLSPKTWELVHGLASHDNDAYLCVFELPILWADSSDDPYGADSTTLSRLRVPTGTSWSDFRGSDPLVGVPPQLQMFTEDSVVDRAVVISSSANWAYVYDSNDLEAGSWLGYHPEIAQYSLGLWKGLGFRSKH